MQVHSSRVNMVKGDDLNSGISNRRQPPLFVLIVEDWWRVMAGHSLREDYSSLIVACFCPKNV